MNFLASFRLSWWIPYSYYGCPFSVCPFVRLSNPLPREALPWQPHDRGPHWGCCNDLHWSRLQKVRPRLPPTLPLAICPDGWKSPIRYWHSPAKAIKKEQNRNTQVTKTTFLDFYLVARHVDAGVHHFDVGDGAFVKRGVTIGKQLIKELISRTRLQNKANCTYSGGEANFSRLMVVVYHYVGIFVATSKGRSSFL